MIPKRKCRQYSVEYMTYGFIPAPQNEQLPMCLFYFQTFSIEAKKPSKMQDHIQIKYLDKIDAPLTHFKGLRDRFNSRNTLNCAFEKSQLKSDDGLIASYFISKLIPRTLQPHTIGDALKYFNGSISTVMHENQSKFIQNIPISNYTVKRRIDEMGQDVELN